MTRILLAVALIVMVLAVLADGARAQEGPDGARETCGILPVYPAGNLAADTPKYRVYTLGFKRLYETPASYGMIFKRSFGSVTYRVIWYAPGVTGPGSPPIIVNYSDLGRDVWVCMVIG